MRNLLHNAQISKRMQTMKLTRSVIDNTELKNALNVLLHRVSFLNARKDGIESQIGENDI